MQQNHHQMILEVFPTYFYGTLTNSFCNHFFPLSELGFQRCKWVWCFFEMETPATQIQCPLLALHVRSARQAKGSLCFTCKRGNVKDPDSWFNTRFWDACIWCVPLSVSTFSWCDWVAEEDADRCPGGWNEFKWHMRSKLKNVYIHMYRCNYI